MPTMCCIDEVEYKQYEDEFIGSANLSSNEDFATLIETVDQVSKVFPLCYVRDIMETKTNQYVCILSSEITHFDIFEYLNSIANSNTKLCSTNVKLLFPLSMSRGLYEYGQMSNAEISTDDLEQNTEDEEAATGLLDNDAMQELQENMPAPQIVERYLIIPETGAKIPIDDIGIIIGRSSKQSDYAVHNPKMSRQHAKIYRDGYKYKVSDLGSANGTFIDGLRVREGSDREITPGARLVLANSEFKFI